MFPSNPWSLTTVKLKPSAFDDEKARVFATIVSEEVERARDDERRGSAPYFVPKGGLLGGPEGDNVYECDSIAWYEFASRPGVIGRCGIRLGLKPATVAAAVVDMLAPPNSMTFFWYGAFLRQVDSTNAAFDLAIQRHQRADAAAVKRVRATIGRDAGLASAKARKRRGPKLTPALAAAERDRLQREEKPESGMVSLIAAKHKVDRSYVYRLLKKHDQESPD